MQITSLRDSLGIGRYEPGSAPVLEFVLSNGDLADSGHDDEDVAGRLGVSQTAVQTARLSIGLQRSTHFASPTVEDILLSNAFDRIGKAKDLDLACEFGVSHEMVSKVRRTLGRPRQFNKLDVDWIALGVGWRLDAEIAGEIGCCVSAVAKNRKRLGFDMRVPRYKYDPRITRHMLRTMTDAEIAKKLGDLRGHLKAGSRTGLVRSARRATGIACRSGKTETITCVQCGRSDRRFRDKFKSTPIRYCSTDCIKRHWQEKNNPPKGSTKAVCPCGTMFMRNTTGKGYGPAAKYCSMRCRKAVLGFAQSKRVSLDTARDLLPMALLMVDLRQELQQQKENGK